MPYLDDYFALWSHGKENLNEFLNFINQLDERIKFTMEVEEDERLSFMDIVVMRFKGDSWEVIEGLRSSLYCPPGLPSNYASTNGLSGPQDTVSLTQIRKRPGNIDF
ncbi:unnamed protein product [Protopolystoma xenopodis]|uniref:Reverse transcriptase domain-containing protein n=1 Tax=Protopolystoma xenopodis TaxID=117903 RepID=A0A448XIA9_9PLAT|nr:unnamed protein product [Protopolystoma xenopodis]